jgi:hypothetical protein
VRTTTTVLRQPAPAGSPPHDDRLVYLGPDQDGVLLEVMAVETDRGVLVIHACPSVRSTAATSKEETTMPEHPDRVIATTKQGTPITEELAEQLAREAEAGYDLSKARRVGRKSLAGGQGRSPRVNFRLRPDLYEHATQRAEREGKTLSQLAREALERYVET